MPHADRIEGTRVLRHEWRQLGRLALESLGTGLFVSLVLALAVFIISVEANAASAGDPGQGTLLLRDDAGERSAAPLLATDVHMDVTGMVARVQVTQRFANPTAQWREGVYVFPLPDKAAVDHLTMRVGERVIEGQIKERAEARRAYETAKTEGRKTTLVEQERPNMFTTSVANIGPGEEIVVALEYEETLRYGDGAFRLRFPLAITPRYIPGAATRGDGHGHGLVAGHGPGAGRRPHHAAVRSGTRRLREPGVDHDRHERGISAGQRRQQLPRHRRRGTSRQSLSHRPGRRAGSRGARLRIGLDAGCRQRAGRGAVHGDARRQDVRIADGAAADARGCRRDTRAAGDHLHHRHVGLDGRRVHRAGARRAVHGPRPAAGGRSLQRHRIQFHQHIAVHGAHALRRVDARAGEAVRRPGCARAAEPKCCPRWRPRWRARRNHR